MARCGCGGADCGCSLTAGNNVTITGSGSSVSPWVVNAVTNCTEVRQCLSANQGAAYDPGTGVISVCVSPNAGNGLTRDANGCLYVAAGAATITTDDCGFTGNGAPATPLALNLGTWPYPCDVTTEAGVVVCDANGQLRGEPIPKMQFQQNSSGTSFPGNPLIPAGETDQVLQSLTLSITNPDDCRPATVILFQEIDVDLNYPPDSEGGVGIDTDDMVHFANYSDTLITRQHVQVNKLTNLTVAAGATLNHTMNVTANRGMGGAYYTRIQATLRAWSFSLPT